MQSNNPVLSKPDAWQPVNATGQYAQYPGQQAPGQPYQGQQYPGQPSDFGPGNQPVQAGRMTIDDVITKSAITMGTLMAVAALTFLFLPQALLWPAAIVGALVSFGVVMVVSFRRQINPGFVLVYAAIEGIFIGAISKVYENLYDGIVPAAVLGTIVAAATTLAAYKFFRIKVTNKFRRMVMIGTIAYAGVLFVNFILSLFGVNLLFGTGTSIGLLLLFSAIGVGLAVFNLILDFDYIEQGVAMGADASQSWRAAFGLTVTMVWLYIEILRLLSYFRR
ncbi:MAG: Bax inhibitor-1/YccA family membrane protein [Propionicimonas sp.]